jgi:hypothetical protein
MIFALLAVLVLAVFAWRYWSRRMPSGLHLGPIINGKSRTVGTRLEGKAFAFPTRGGHVHALVQPTDKVGEAITLRYRIEADEGVTFHPVENPTATATISLMLQRKGDDFQSVGAKEFYRLYGPVVHEIAPGEHEIAITPGSLGWIGVYAKEPSPAQWDDVLANLAAIHVCFGGGGSRSHGVFASGQARFVMLGLG